MAAETTAVSASPPLKTSNLSRAFTAPIAPIRPTRRRSSRTRPPTTTVPSPRVPVKPKLPNGVSTKSSSTPRSDQRHIPVAVAPPPAWARDVLRSVSMIDDAPENAKPPSPPLIKAVPDERVRHGDVVRSAVRALKAQPVPEKIAGDKRIPTALVELLMDTSVFSSKEDRTSVIAAARSFASTDREACDALVKAKVLHALVTVARQANASAKRDLLTNRPHFPPSLFVDSVVALSQLVDSSQSACADALESGALSVLADAAATDQPMQLRVQACSGLVAIASWSGPRQAVPIVETPGVVKAMSTLLTEKDDLVTDELRSATMSALVAMSTHRTARRILKENGCDEKITAAAKNASLSGNFDFAAQGTLAAGHVAGHSVDEFGFLVLDVENADLMLDSSNDLTGSPVTTSDQSRSSPTTADPDSGSGEDNPASPLLAFSNVTRRANPRMQKSDSEKNRDIEHERIWRDVIENKPYMLAREVGKVRRVKEYRALVSVPVPSSMRRILWPLLLDVEQLRESKPNLYESLCRSVEEEALNDDWEHTIEADVTRTMPLHALFWSGGAQVGVKSLRSILRAYARYQPEVGYCQGMSPVAAVFLMNANNEEDAFLMFSQFMEHYQYKKVFAEGFPKMRQWLTELRPLIYHYMPKLWERLERENVPLELYADKWLITALSHNFPHRYLLRVWDLMFLGGSPKIILKACLAVLKTAESRLMTMHFEGIMHMLQRDFAKPETGLLDEKNPEPFLKMARDFRFEENVRQPPTLTRPPSSHHRPSMSQSASRVRSRPSPRENTRPQRRAGCLCFGKSDTLD